MSAGTGAGPQTTREQAIQTCKEWSEFIRQQNAKSPNTVRESQAVNNAGERRGGKS